MTEAGGTIEVHENTDCDTLTSTKIADTCVAEVNGLTTEYYRYNCINTSNNEVLRV